jgi:small nuclear ribonucleoprotein (snRNP)-like protein
LSISSVKLNANRVVIGTLRGFDQFMNLVVDNTVEVNGNDKTDIGMVVSFLLLKVIVTFSTCTCGQAVLNDVLGMLRKISFFSTLAQ